MSAAVAARQPVALVYRPGKAGQQYAFFTPEHLEAWAARHPYRNERLALHVVRSARVVMRLEVEAAKAASVLRSMLQVAA